MRLIFVLRIYLVAIVGLDPWLQVLKRLYFLMVPLEFRVRCLSSGGPARDEGQDQRYSDTQCGRGMRGREVPSSGPSMLKQSKEGMRRDKNDETGSQCMSVASYSGGLTRFTRTKMRLSSAVLSSSRRPLDRNSCISTKPNYRHQQSIPPQSCKRLWD